MFLYSLSGHSKSKDQPGFQSLVSSIKTQQWLWFKGISVRELAADTVLHFHHVIARTYWEQAYTRPQLKHTPMRARRTSVALPHLASWLGSFPDAEVADEPGQGQTQGQLPAHAAHVLNTIWDLQHSAPDWAQTPYFKFLCAAVVSNSQMVPVVQWSHSCYFLKEKQVASSLHGASETISHNVKPSPFAGKCLADDFSTTGK